MKTKKKLFIYKIAISILIIIAIILGAIIFKKQYDDQIFNNENIEIAKQFEEKLKKLQENKNEERQENKQKIEILYKGFDVIGLIEIPTIELKYPILSTTTKATMKTAISKFDGGDINEYGNVSLAGHNNYSGTMFGKNNKLKVGDLIYLTDLKGNKIAYEIYNTFVTNPDDTSILETKDETVREVTLITCKNGRAERFIIKAKEKV